MSPHQIGTTEDLARLTRRPMALPKWWSMSRSVLISDLAGWMKITASSAYRLVRMRTAVPGTGESYPAPVAASNSRCRE